MPACKCIERKKPANQRKWRILQYKCNHSAFNVGGINEAITAQ